MLPVRYPASLPMVLGERPFGTRWAWSQLLVSSKIDLTWANFACMAVRARSLLDSLGETALDS